MSNSNLPMPADFGSYKVGNQMFALTPDVIKNAICPNLNEIEILNFGFMCQQNNLNPFTREAYAIKYGSNPASLIIAKQGLANRGERSGLIEYKKEGIIETKLDKQSGEWITREVEGSFIDPGWQLYGAFAVVKRKDRTEPMVSRVLFSEYNNDKNPLWKSKPCTMLVKVAMQHALRDSFPCELPNGVYYEEEFRDDMNPKSQNKPTPVHNDFDDVEEASVAVKPAVDTETGEIKLEP